MWYRLAEMLGYTVGQLKATMPSAEFTDWLAELGIRNDEQEAQASAVRVQDDIDEMKRK